MQESVKKRAEQAKKFELKPHPEKPTWKRLMLPIYLGRDYADDKALGTLFLVGGVLVVLLKFVILPNIEVLEADMKQAADSKAASQTPNKPPS